MLLLDVLEHVARERRVVEEVYRVLRPGGTLATRAVDKGALAWLYSLNVWDFYGGLLSHPIDEVIPGGYPYHRHYGEADLRARPGSRFEVRAVERTGLGVVESLNLAILLLCKGLLRSQWLYDRLAFLYYGAYIVEISCAAAGLRIT